MRKRKLLIWLTAVLLAVVAAGCGKHADETGPGAPASGASGSTGTAGGGQDTPSNGGTAPEPAEKVQLGPLAVGDTAEVGPLTVTVSKIEAVDQAPAPGYTYVLVELTVENSGAAAYTVNPTEQHKVQTPEEKNAPYNLQATAVRSPRLQGTLKQGESVTGWLGFLAKKMEGTYTYTFTHPDYGEAVWEFSL